MSTISVLMPTRKRTILAEKSIDGLLSKAKDQSSIELLLAVDNDDVETRKWLDTHYLAKAKSQFKSTVTPIYFDRLGYHQMNKYLNTLASLSKGEWLFFWNDDGNMITNAWEQIIYHYNGLFALLRAQVVNHPHPFALFPIVPRKWYELLGFLSSTCQTDRFIYEVAVKVKVQECLINIPLYLEHDRFDLTGNNNDEVYKERIYMEGDPTNPDHADSPEAQASVWWSAMVISKYIAIQKGINL